MGIDMYAFKVSPNLIVQSLFKDELPAEATCVEIQFWHNHPDLHGWMKQLYCARQGLELCLGHDDVFKRTALRLLPENIDQLERDIANGQLPEMNVWLFGHSNSEGRRDCDLEFIHTAREALADGLWIYYEATW